MCDRCGCGMLLIKRTRGWEWLMVKLTGKRRYFCMRCGHQFRMVDRRRYPRPEPSEVSEAGGVQVP